jgi:hypothetical protein
MLENSITPMDRGDAAWSCLVTMSSLSERKANGFNHKEHKNHKAKEHKNHKAKEHFFRGRAVNKTVT